MIRKSILVLCMALLAAATASADNKEQKRLENSGAVMQEIMNVPDNIPQEVMEKAECVIVFPSVLKAAFVVGASYGRGAMVCRTGKDFRGPWGAPAMYGARRRQRRFPNRRTSHRSSPACNERSRRELRF